MEDQVEKEYESEIFAKYQDMSYLAYKKSAFALDWNCNGKYLATADNTIKIYKYRNLALQKESEVKAHSLNVETLAWHPIQKQVLCTCSRDSVKLWKYKAREIKMNHSYKSKADNTYLCWSPDGSQLAVGNKDNVIIFFDSETFKPVQEMKLEDSEINEFAWDPKGSVLFVAACSKNIGYIKVYNGKNPTQPLAQLECHRAMISTLQIDPTGKYFATGGNDAMVAIWDMYEMICTDTFHSFQGIVKKLSFSNDGKYLATATDDDFISIYNNQKRLLSYRIKQPQADQKEEKRSINIVKWHPTEMVLAYISEVKKESSREVYLTVFGEKNK
ncbi:WD40-repeat-containing domain [Pseudocohnilembus persalinus]|uniref:WD40-repeat-containing domain n=1 Tax=Pseudocohnilembus persalinus TaxID=266149 RepID=A0A0V0R0E2_PSEPJ|nr:WD40-repeat-containing domain [Pseudocohnilembus persalinus]|eukprot:KRX08031.1 WD40-repeat-containing domain [Pseudocohnilembus persalinus]